jgi:hypothetical protein
MANTFNVLVKMLLVQWKALAIAVLLSFVPSRCTLSTSTSTCTQLSSIVGLVLPLGPESIMLGGFFNVTFCLFVRWGRSVLLIVDCVTAHIFVFYTFLIRDVHRCRKHEKQRKTRQLTL